MPLQLENDHFEADALVTFAKALFSNLDALRGLEVLGADMHGSVMARLHLRSERDVLLGHFRRGLFLQMRRLLPLLTDDGIEKRMARTIRRLRDMANDRQMRLTSRPVKERAGFDDAIYLAHDLLPDVLDTLAETFLCEGNDGSIRVRTHLLAHWQDLVLVVPPLIISSAWMARRIDIPALASSGRAAHQKTVDLMTRWLCDSTLPVDDDPYLDFLCRHHGLDEVHMHLNGATEAEKIWCDALRDPLKIVGGLIDSAAKTRESGLHIAIGSGVDRLLLQEDSGLTRQHLRRRVEDAARLKARLLNAALGETDPAGADEVSAAAAYAAARKKSLSVLPECLPFVVKEAWHLCRIIAQFQNRHTPQKLGLPFWHYVLLRAQFCRLLVQQVSQTGFDQFQHITLNELREPTETDYAERFRQIERGGQRGVEYVEGRFAPKSTPDKTAKLIGDILRGYLRFLDEEDLGEARPPKMSAHPYRSLTDLVALVAQRETGLRVRRQDDHSAPAGQESLRTQRRLRLGLVVHFIKRTTLKERSAFFGDHPYRPACRDSVLRRELDQNARALVSLLRSTKGLAQYIRGADTASNERHAGPEVFAPIFRQLRKAGIKRFTYHAGEDFSHIVSGLRAMYEVVLFLNFDAGCRIGHGTASGLDPAAWWSAVGDGVIMPREERLDDLIFARELLLLDRTAHQSLVQIDAEIQRLSLKIWCDPRISPELLADAWKFRALDPLAFGTDTHDVDPLRADEARRFAADELKKPEAFKQFLRRHGISENAEKSVQPPRDELERGQEEIVILKQTDVLGPDIIQTLQRCLLKILQERRIAIETLPSSNVRISIHQRYEDHHIQNWLMHDNRTGFTSPDILIGSDNPGIFATSLRLEYAHMIRCLRNRSGGAENALAALPTIERICIDAKRYRF